MVLKKALEKSIAQWQLMVDDPNITKIEAYKQIGGDKQYTRGACFLCDAIISMHCKNCLSWNVGPYKCACLKTNSPYRKWLDSIAKSEEELEAAKNVLKYLKNELEKIMSNEKSYVLMTWENTYFVSQNLYLGRAEVTEDLNKAALLSLDEAERKYNLMGDKKQWEIWKVKQGLVLDKKSERHLIKDKLKKLKAEIAIQEKKYHEYDLKDILLETN